MSIAKRAVANIVKPALNGADPKMSFGKFRGMWLDRVHDDPEMKGDDCRVMYAITRFMRDSCRTPKPGNVTLAETAHVNERTVRRALAKAKLRGHLAIKEDGRRSPRILIPLLQDSRETGQDVHTESGQSGHESGHESGLESGHCHPGLRVESNWWKPSSQESQESQESQKIPVSGGSNISESFTNGQTRSDWLAFRHLCDSFTDPGPITADNVNSYIEHFTKLGLLEVRDDEITVTPAGAAYAARCYSDYERKAA